jgi:hypothetical protein
MGLFAPEAPLFLKFASGNGGRGRGLAFPIKRLPVRIGTKKLIGATKEKVPAPMAPVTVPPWHRLGYPPSRNAVRTT